MHTRAAAPDAPPNGYGDGVSEHDVVTGRAGEQEPPARARRAALPPGVLAPALASLLCVVLTVLTWRAFETTRRGQLVEEAARLGSEGARDRFSDVTSLLLGVVSVPFLVLVVAAAVLVALAQRRWSIAVAAIVVLVGANVTTQVLQASLERPSLGVSSLVMNSFPSGHATVAASIAVTALLVAPVGWRAAIALLGTLVSAALGISTMIGVDTTAWHRGSDVVAAMLIASAWYFLVEAVLAWLTERDGGPGARSRTAGRLVRPVLRVLTVLGGLCGGLGMGALAATALRVPVGTDLGEQVAFAGSVLGVAAVACGLQALMLRLRPHHPAPRTEPV